MAEWKRRAINLLAGVYVVAVVAFAVPVKLPLQHQIRVWIEPAMRATGLWQWWDMFAPRPPTANIWLTSVITWSDGTSEEHEFPRMSKEGYFERYPGENFNKAEEWIRNDKFKQTWPDVAAWCTRQYARPGATVQKVELVKNSFPIPRFNGPNAKIFPAVETAPKRDVLYTLDASAQP
jgi:hypothetical protein